MSPFYLLSAFAAAALIYIAYTLLTSDKKLKKKFESQFGKRPDREGRQPEGFFWKEKLKSGCTGFYIDNITWDDLDMDKVFSRIDSCQSSAGKECLYAMMREPLFDKNALSVREDLIIAMAENKELRTAIQVLLHKLGGFDGGSLATFCYEVSSKRIGNPKIINMLAILPLLFIGLAFIDTAAGIICLAAAIISNGIVYYRTKRKIDRELVSIRYFSALLWCAGKITKKHLIDNFPAGKTIAKGFDRFKKLGGSLSGLMEQRVSDLDFIAEYVKIVFLSSIRNYNKIVDILDRNTNEFRSLYKEIGEVDAAITISSFRASLPLFSCPVFKETASVIIEDIYHPLLSDPVLNSAELSYALVSGSNASGKSTFIKAAAVNGILAQTIHTCTAHSFITPLALVMTSMAVRDDIAEGESYFIKEIKSLRRIIHKLPEVFCACYIDEILKGTNTIERIAASASVLSHIRNKSCICVVATHDIELTRIMSGFYNYHFSEHITDNGVEFDYAIKHGPSATKNAVKLLEHMGFDGGITEGAKALVSKFEETRVWDILN